MLLLQIPLPPVDEKKKVTEDVEKDRRYAIDAAIVRTMKSRKTLNHQGVSLQCTAWQHLLNKQMCTSMNTGVIALIMYVSCWHPA